MEHRFFRGSRIAAVALGFLLVVPAQQSAGQGASNPTPRTAEGKPDLTGVWRGTRTLRGGVAVLPTTGTTEADGGSTFIFGSRRCAPNQKGCRDVTNEANDYELLFRNYPNRPLYKAEYWDKVQFLDYDTNFSDPLFRCVPYGVPRVGAPTAILPVPQGVMFLYAGRDHDYRLIPTDGRGHNPDHLPGYWGDAVGRWEGDTLVVETIGFNNTTWIAGGIVGGGGAYFHSFEMRVFERFRREGNTLHYEVTVEDPEVLLEPWAMDPQTLTLDTKANALFGISEGTPCENIDNGIQVSRIRH